MTLHRSRQALALLVLASALLLRAAVPTGWMPMTDGDGSLRIMLCDGTGPVELAAAPTGEHAHHEVGHSGHHGEGHDDGHGDAPRDPCPFGLALSSALDLPPAPATAPDLLFDAPLDPAAFVIARLAAWRSLRPPARGPPAFA